MGLLDNITQPFTQLSENITNPFTQNTQPNNVNTGMFGIDKETSGLLGMALMGAGGNNNLLQSMMMLKMLGGDDPFNSSNTGSINPNYQPNYNLPYQNQANNQVNSLVNSFKHGGAQSPTEIIFHDTAGPDLQSAMDTLKQRGLSYHYIVDRNGQVVPLVDPSMKAWHALGHNNNTVGISFVGGGKYGNINDAQNESAAQLALQLKNQYPGLQTLTGHSHRSNAGKIDPEGFNYDWMANKTGLRYAP